MADYSGIGQDIAAGILRTKKEKEAYDAQLARAEAMSRMGVKGGQIVQIDPNVKDKDIVPFVNQKALDDIKSNASHNRAQKTGEIKAYTEIGIANMRMQLQQAARAAAQPRTQYQVAPGYPSRNIPETQASAQDLQRLAAEERAKANVPKEQREVRKEGREEGRYAKEMRQPESDFIKSQPEIKFFDKTGMPPSAFLTPQSVEQGYQIKAPEGQIVGEVPPLKPGESLTDVRRRPSWFKEAYTFGLAGPEKVTPSWVPKPMMDPNTGQPMIDPNTNQPVMPAYRVKEYKYGGLPSKDKPESIRYAPHPEGEFLQIGDRRVPYQDVAEIRQVADTRKREALQALSIHPELRPKIENRLQQWHYDLTNPFWADLYKTGTMIYQ